MTITIKKQRNPTPGKTWIVTMTAGNNRVWNSASGYNTAASAKRSVKNLVKQIQAGTFTVKIKK